MKHPELPAGVAAYFVHGDNLDTMCALVSAKSSLSNDLPDSLDHWHVLAVGIAFFNPKDDEDNWTEEKGEVISAGRALKMYHELYDEKPDYLF